MKRIIMLMVLCFISTVSAGTHADTASYADTAGYANLAGHSDSSDFANHASYSDVSGYSIDAKHADRADYAYESVHSYFSVQAKKAFYATHSGISQFSSRALNANSAKWANKAAHLNEYTADDLLQYSDNGDIDINQYINEHETVWSEDKIGSSGISEHGLSRRLVGFSTFFDMDISLLDYLFGIFTTKEELEQTNERIDLIEARLNYPDASPEQVAFEAGLIRANRLNEPQEVNGFTCVPGNIECISVVTVS